MRKWWFGLWISAVCGAEMAVGGAEMAVGGVVAGFSCLVSL